MWWLGDGVLAGLLLLVLQLVGVLLQQLVVRVVALVLRIHIVLVLQLQLRRLQPVIRQGTGSRWGRRWRRWWHCIIIALSRTKSSRSSSGRGRQRSRSNLQRCGRGGCLAGVLGRTKAIQGERGAVALLALAHATPAPTAAHSRGGGATRNGRQAAVRAYVLLRLLLLGGGQLLLWDRRLLLLLLRLVLQQLGGRGRRRQRQLLTALGLRLNGVNAGRQEGRQMGLKQRQLIKMQAECKWHATYG